MENVKLTEEQLNNLKHAVGYDGKTPFYRNYYCADKYSNNDKLWISLITCGYAEVIRNKARDLYDYNIYRVNEKGIKYLKWLKEQEHLSNNT